MPLCKFTLVTCTCRSFCLRRQFYLVLHFWGWTNVQRTHADVWLQFAHYTDTTQFRIIIKLNLVKVHFRRTTMQLKKHQARNILSFLAWGWGWGRGRGGGDDWLYAQFQGRPEQQTLTMTHFTGLPSLFQWLTDLMRGRLSMCPITGTRLRNKIACGNRPLQVCMLLRVSEWACVCVRVCVCVCVCACVRERERERERGECMLRMT